METSKLFMKRLGDISAERVIAQALPGRAMEADLLKVITGHARRLVELIDGILVEKCYGMHGSVITAQICCELGRYCDENDRYFACGPALPFRMESGNVLMPSATLTAWDRIPNGKLSSTPICDTVPILMLEVMRPENTLAEMEFKVAEFFVLGSQCCWIVDPTEECARVYLSANACEFIGADGALHGGEILPDLRISLSEVLEIPTAPDRK